MHIDPNLEHTLLNTRRQFLGSTSIGLGGIAMGALSGRSQLNADVSYDPTSPQLPRDTHFPAKAKRVI